MLKNTDAVKQNLINKNNYINNFGSISKWTIAQNEKAAVVKNAQEYLKTGMKGVRIVIRSKSADKAQKFHNTQSKQTDFGLIPSAEFLKTQKKNVRRQYHAEHEDLCVSADNFLSRN